MPQQFCHKGLRGFTLIELLIVITIIAILAALLFPVFARAREKARQAGCQSNLRQLDIAFQMYMDDYDGTAPLVKTGASPTMPYLWFQLTPYVRNRQIWYCPSAKPVGTNFTTQLNKYGFNRLTLTYWTTVERWTICDTSVPNPAGTFLAFDFDEDDGVAETDSASTTNEEVDYYGLGPTSKHFNRHNSGFNVLYWDGHVKYKRAGTGTRADYTPQEDPT